MTEPEKDAENASSLSTSRFVTVAIFLTPECVTVADFIDFGGRTKGPVPRVVNVLTARLLRAWWLPMFVDVGPEQVLGADEGAGRELEDHELVRGCSVGEAGRSRERWQADPGRRAEQQCWVQAGLDAGPTSLHQLPWC